MVWLSLLIFDSQAADPFREFVADANKRGILTRRSSLPIERIE